MFILKVSLFLLHRVNPFHLRNFVENRSYFSDIFSYIPCSIYLLGHVSDTMFIFIAARLLWN